MTILKLDVAIETSKNVAEQIIDVIRKVFPNKKVIANKRFNDGISNQVHQFVMEQHDGGIEKVLVRVNGNNTEKFIDRDVEENLLIQMAGYGQAPKIYCRFTNGVVYEFFEGDTLQPEILQERSTSIAKKLAQFHKMNIEFDKTPVFNLLTEKYLSQINEISFEDKEKQEKLQSLNMEKIKQEINDIIKKHAKSFPISFCHNDLLAYNIIHNKEKDIYQFIDYEYCGYNYRGYDIGNHFCEYCGFDLNLSAYPSKAAQEKFIKAYLTESLGRNPTSKEIEELYVEANICSLMSSLFWGIWGVLQARYSQIDFDYLSYAKSRFDWYYGTKEQVLSLSQPQKQ